MAVMETAATPARQIGQQLHAAREAAGLSVDTAAARLRMQKRLVLALEAGDWSHLGAPVFVRGHLRSYARLLGIELSELDDMTTPPPTLVVPMVRARRGQQWFGRMGTRLVYAVITLLVGVPVWMAAQRHLSAPDEAARPVALGLSEVTPPAPVPAQDNMPAPSPNAPPPPLTTVASLLLPPAQTEAPAWMTLHLNEDSWVELYAPDGQRLEQDLLKAGEVRHFRRGQLGRAVIGNADGVTLRVGEEIQELTHYRRANVARFAVSSDGSIGPVAD